MTDSTFPTQRNTSCTKRKEMEMEVERDHSSSIEASDSKSQPRMKLKRTSRHMKDTRRETFEFCYVLGVKLGDGGYGSVFRGTRISDGLQVAIKFFPKDKDMMYFSSHKESERMPIEVALMQLMSLPPACNNTVQLYEWFEEPDRFILIMEFPQPCVDLYTFLTDHGVQISEELAKIIMYRTVVAASQCHRRHVFHRDIKPENMLVNTETLDVKLIDFGCGDLVNHRGYHYFRGTPEYCPPEFLLRGLYHARPATVWSLGVLLFSIINGDLPFEDDEDIIKGHLKFTTGLSDECCSLIQWCLQPSPDKRPDFEQILQHDWFREVFVILEDVLHEINSQESSKQ